MTLKKIFGFCVITVGFNVCFADNVLHTTIFHNANQKTMTFSVNFGIGYQQAGSCHISKRRLFTSTIKNNFHAKNYGHYLAKEYGPELYTCVTETIRHRNCKSISWTYQLKNNGTYYTQAIPAITHIYPK